MSVDPSPFAILMRAGYLAGGGMAKGEDEVLVQLATRIPKELHRRVKLQCVQTETAVIEFVVTALQEKLAKSAGGKLARGE